MITSLPPLQVEDPIAFAQRGEIYKARVQACGNDLVFLWVDLGGIFVQRRTRLAREGVEWVRCKEDYTGPQDVLEAFKAAHALSRDSDDE